jgi:hypothetical protein
MLITPPKVADRAAWLPAMAAAAIAKSTVAANCHRMTLRIEVLTRIRKSGTPPEKMSQWRNEAEAKPKILRG